MERRRNIKEGSQEKLARGRRAEEILKFERDSGEDNSWVHANTIHLMLYIIINAPSLISGLHPTKQTTLSIPTYNSLGTPSLNKRENLLTISNTSYIFI